MQQVILKPLHHREQECIGIYFENNTAINNAIRQQASARWSRTNKCWYVPLSKENYNKVAFALKGKAAIEQSVLHDYLSNKKRKALVTNSVSPAKKTIPVVKQISIADKKPIVAPPSQ
jgi:hypothetical protein